MTPHALTIIIPIFNAEATLDRTLRSLAIISADHRRDVTILAVDDGSTDRSSQVFRQVACEIPGFSWRLIRKENGGSASARNCALKEFETGWVLFLDADDELAVDPLPLLNDRDDASALIFGTAYIRGNTCIRKAPPRLPPRQGFATAFASGNFFHPSAVIFRRERLVSMFDEELRYLEDWHFWAVNPHFFDTAVAFHDIVSCRAHIVGTNKSGHQYRSGRSRILAADRIEAFWGAGLARTARNNLEIQRQIGAIQMGGRPRLSNLLRLPLTPMLYAKLIVYTFFFPLYERYNLYGSRPEKDQQ